MQPSATACRSRSTSSIRMGPDCYQNSDSRISLQVSPCTAGPFNSVSACWRVPSALIPPEGGLLLGARPPRSNQEAGRPNRSPDHLRNGLVPSSLHVFYKIHPCILPSGPACGCSNFVPDKFVTDRIQRDIPIASLLILPSTAKCPKNMPLLSKLKGEL